MVKGKTVAIKKYDIIRKFINDIKKTDIRYYTENQREIWVIANEGFDFKQFGLPYEELN